MKSPRVKILYFKPWRSDKCDGEIFLRCVNSSPKKSVEQSTRQARQVLESRDTRTHAETKITPQLLQLCKYFKMPLSGVFLKMHGVIAIDFAKSIKSWSRSIDAFVPFKVVTRLIFWDERSLYFEQSFVSLHDGFVRAVALCKNTVVGGSVVEMLAGLGVDYVPEMPKEVIWFRF